MPHFSRRDLGVPGGDSGATASVSAAIQNAVNFLNDPKFRGFRVVRNIDKS